MKLDSDELEKSARSRQCHSGKTQGRCCGKGDTDLTPVAPTDEDGQQQDRRRLDRGRCADRRTCVTGPAIRDSEQQEDQRVDVGPDQSRPEWPEADERAGQEEVPRVGESWPEDRQPCHDTQGHEDAPQHRAHACQRPEQCRGGRKVESHRPRGLVWSEPLRRVERFLTEKRWCGLRVPRDVTEEIWVLSRNEVSGGRHGQQCSPEHQQHAPRSSETSLRHGVRVRHLPGTSTATED